MLGRKTNEDDRESVPRTELTPAQRRTAAIRRAEEQYGLRLVSLGEVSRVVRGVGRNARDRVVRAELFTTTKMDARSFIRWEEYPDQCIPQFEVGKRVKPDPEPPVRVSQASLRTPSGYHPAAGKASTEPLNTPVTW